MDFNMMTGRVMAISLFSVSSRPQDLPSSIQDVQTRARLVHDIDRAMAPHFAPFDLSPAFKGQIFTLPQSSIDAMLKDVTAKTEQQIKDVDDANARNGVALSLWSGCTDAAKTIALGTRDGENTPESRMVIFTNLIDPLSEIVVRT